MKNNSEYGFSYIDVMIAIVILMVGVLALLAAITGAVVMSTSQEKQLTAKQLVSSTMEAIISTKETDSERLGWNKVGNVGSNPDVNGIGQGIFVVGVQPIKSNAGADLIIGTTDDSGANVVGFTREITITDVCDPDRPSPTPLCTPAGPFGVKIRTIEIKVFYNVNSIQRQETLKTVLTEY